MKLLMYASACPLLLLAQVAQAATSPPLPVPMSSYKSTIETVGTGIAIALPVMATSVTVFKHDRPGAAELLVTTLLSMGTVYALKNIVHEERPDGSGMHAFPSENTALAASSADYLWGRYGWSYGLPAFAATSFVSFSRTQAKKERWYDTATSSVIAAAFSLTITKRFKQRYDIRTQLSAAPNGGFASLSYEW
jgi:hypothetical protein